MILVTSGWKFTDIDAFGAAVGYAELLTKQGKNAIAVLEGVLNGSITTSVRSWNVPYETSHVSQPDDEYIVVDISDPAYFSQCVDTKKLVEVVDHHPGFETYWEQRGVKADIRHIGAACTQIFERWEKAGLLESMSENTAKLLGTGILDNTLYFKAAITSDYDKYAYKKCAEIGKLDSTWPAVYFSECQSEIESDLPVAINNDHKRITFAGYDRPIDIGQLVVWDGRRLLARKVEMEAAMRGYAVWLLHIVSISEGKSYLISDSRYVHDFVKDIMGVSFEGDVAVTNRMWQRKEMMKRAIERERRGE